jgi:putative intracellular protease/amidase
MPILAVEYLRYTKKEGIMKHLLFISMLIIGVTSSSISELYSQESNKVLLFIQDGSVDLEFMLKKEVGVMKDILEQSGFEVTIATVSGEPIVAGSIKLKPDLKLGDVSVTDYVGFILPCMAASDASGALLAIEAVTMVKNAAAEGKPVAAQLGSVLILARAGVLIDKKYAFADSEDLNANLSPDLKDCGGIYNGTGVIQDGNIITSGVCPYWARMSELQDGTQELSQTLIKVIKANTI